jgi:hypothetical protein
MIRQAEKRRSIKIAQEADRKRWAIYESLSLEEVIGLQQPVPEALKPKRPATIPKGEDLCVRACFSYITTTEETLEVRRKRREGIIAPAVAATKTLGLEGSVVETFFHTPLQGINVPKPVQVQANQMIEGAPRPWLKAMADGHMVVAHALVSKKDGVEYLQVDPKEEFLRHKPIVVSPSGPPLSLRSIGLPMENHPPYQLALKEARLFTKLCTKCKDLPDDTDDPTTYCVGCFKRMKVHLRAFRLFRDARLPPDYLDDFTIDEATARDVSLATLSLTSGD